MCADGKLSTSVLGGIGLKIDRILEIIVYLLNHENTSASFLARRFQVSVRTIQRDMISISLAGVPVYALGGKNGGYSILPEYKIRNHVIGKTDQQLVLRALESLSTAYTNDKLENLIEKYNSIVDQQGGQKIFWDFGVTRENQSVQAVNQQLENAILMQRIIVFIYRNADGGVSQKTVQPLAIQYKWYAWYLFAYIPGQNAYRTYKVARISGLQVTDTVWEKKHDDLKKLLKESESAYYSTCIHIEVRFCKDDRGLMEEYFPDCPIEALSAEECRTCIHVPQKERLWKALLLSFGDKVRIVAPEAYKNELIQTARSFLSNYDI